MISPSTLVTAFYAALESGQHGDQLLPFFAPDAHTVEHPNALVPAGRTSDLDAMSAGSDAGAALLERQAYDVRALAEVGDEVVVRLVWTGVVRADAGPFRAGQVLTAHIAQFVRVEDGRIARIETYDCYEPFERALRG